MTGDGGFMVREGSPGIWGTVQRCSGLAQAFPETAQEKKSIFRKTSQPEILATWDCNIPPGG